MKSAVIFPTFYEGSSFHELHQSLKATASSNQQQIDFPDPVITSNVDFEKPSDLLDREEDILSFLKGIQQIIKSDYTHISEKTVYACQDGNGIFVEDSQLHFFGKIWEFKDGDCSKFESPPTG